ncbi:SDR family oxidoreductase [Methanosarcina sp. 1.H.T.1A.1]|uniref:SDR family oxidoreductase n=1 Tax=Methanosarcina sp. 1.H.T.1A.1 TaxID=1483602 RepID=UPI00064E8A74|nr:SDR family oxidoreductase [Methanosarcina sp. 1.H.T.1A.1]
MGGRVAHYLKENDPQSNIFLTTRNKKSRKLPLWAEKFTVLDMDVLNEDSIDYCLKNKNIDVIIHLAAMNEIDSMKNPESALNVNTLGTYKLLKVAHSNNINRFIYFSTFHVYGEPTSPIITEESPTRPFHPYAITHRAAEDFVVFFNHYYGMNTLIFRLSNSYGYPMDKEINRWTLVFNDLCRQTVTTGKIVLKSSGKQYRDFIPLHDVARAVHHFLFVKPEYLKDGIYNLGGNCSMSILDVAQRVSSVYQSKYKDKSIDIIVKSDDNSVVPRPFEFSIEKLLGTGFTLKGNLLYEIEKTMELCEEFII